MHPLTDTSRMQYRISIAKIESNPRKLHLQLLSPTVERAMKYDKLFWSHMVQPWQKSVPVLLK